VSAKTAVLKSADVVNNSVPLAPVIRKSEIKKKKIARIFEKMYRALVNSRGIYAIAKMETHAPQTKYYPGSPATLPPEPKENPQSTMFEEEQPKRGEVKIMYPLSPMTLLHRRWLWFTTLTDRRELSERVYRAHCEIYADHPEFYNEEVLRISPEEFRQAFKEKSYKIGSPSQSVDFWLKCAKTLFEEFEGDPVKLLKHAGWSVEKVYAWKKQQRKLRGEDPIPGWGRKLLSLYFMYLAELGYNLPDDAFPADVHAQAIVIQSGSFDFGSKVVINTSQLAEGIRKEITSLCREENWSPVHVAHASWLLGSQLCTKCSATPETPLLCPIYDDCKGRVDTGSYFVYGLWRKNGQVMNKGGTRPPYGLPTDVPPRDSKKMKREPIPIIPLFPKK